MRRAAAVLLLVLAASCGSDGPPIYTADDRPIEVEDGDEFVLELADSPEDSRRWELVPGAERLDALEEDIERLRQVRQAERALGVLEVFVEVRATPEELDEVEATLRGDERVRDLEFISRAEQYELFREFFKGRAEYLQNVRPTDLPESFRITPSPACATLVDQEADGDRRRFRFRVAGRCSTDIEATYVEAEGEEPTTMGGQPQVFRVRPAG